MSRMLDPLDLPVAILRERLASGAVRSGEVCESVLARIAASPDARDALAWIDEPYARQVAAGRDGYRVRQKALGNLHGLPVLLDDAIDLERVASRRGFAPLEGARAERDAALVRALRLAGAQLFAKSTIAPLRLGGLEDAGGAASLLAASAFPLAVVMDGRGEALRAAAKAGLCAYRPSAGLVSREGLFVTAPSLDGIACLAPDLSGLASLADTVLSAGATEEGAAILPVPQLGAALEAPPAMPPVIGCLTDGRELAAEALGELAEALGERAFTAALPAVFAEAGPQSARIEVAETGKALAPYLRRYPDAACPPLGERVATAEAMSALDYLRAFDWRPVLAAGMNEIFARCDVAAILGPLDAAPINTNEGQESGTGTKRQAVVDESLPAFLGLPHLTLPLLKTPDGAPLGLTLIARRYEDARLMRVAGWLLTTLNGEDR